jgi:carbamoyl-phosphate synthase/aspartate carbamoyltransferase/dihydroorotase
VTTLTWPGLIDAHVHLREPGATHKEDVTSGTSAALAGGVLGILDMPNNTPPTVNRLTFTHKGELFAHKAVSDYGLFLGFDGADVAALADVGPSAVGLKLYLDQTFGDMTTREPRTLAAVFEAWPGPGPIAIHAESAAIAQAIVLSGRYRQRLHVCHVPHPDELLRIDDARQRGIAVTCEVTPHHLFLCAEDAERLGPYAHMKPPLVSARDRARFWERLDLVDIIASDHAPHTRVEKDSATPPPGVPGLETTLPLLLYAVDQGRLTPERLRALTWDNPLRVYGLAAPPDSGIEVELGAPYRLPASGYHTRCDWTPFAGQWALGRVARVRLRGRTVWQDGTLIAAPGTGRQLTRSSAFAKRTYTEREVHA